MTVTINGTTGIAGTNGSAGTPAVQGEDTNTGVFFPAADTVAVATSGAERVRITSAGLVGIDNTAPDGNLTVGNTSTSGDVSIRIKGDATSRGFLMFGDAGGAQLGDIMYDHSDNHMRFRVNNAERARIDASGNLLVGTTSQYGSQKLSLNGGIAIDGRSAVTPGLSEKSDDNTGVFWPTADTLGFSTGGTERARIDASGNLLVGTTTISGDGISLLPRSSASGSTSQIAFNRASTTSSGSVLAFLNAGTVVGTVQHTNTATSYNTSSDYRLKENVQPMQDALGKIAQLNPVTYTWKADGSAGQGFIAHELQAVVPDCVTGEKDAVDAEGNPQYQGVDTSFLVATLVKAIQELTARVAELEAQ